jgi:hypothetical protein
MLNSRVEAKFSRLRDIAASFLDSALFADDRAEANDLVLQIRNDYRGRRVVGRGDKEIGLPQAPTPEYKVFLGQSVEASKALKHMNLHVVNRQGYSGRELVIRVELARPNRRAPSDDETGRK